MVTAQERWDTVCDRLEKLTDALAVLTGRCDQLARQAESNRVKIGTLEIGRAHV